MPLRENDHGRTTAARLKQLRVHAIIFRPRRCDGAREGEHVVGERVIVSRSGGEPFVAARYRITREIFQPAARVAFVCRAADMFQPPSERQHTAIRLLREAHLFVSRYLLFDPRHDVQTIEYILRRGLRSNSERLRGGRPSDLAACLTSANRDFWPVLTFDQLPFDLQKWQYSAHGE